MEGLDWSQFITVEWRFALSTMRSTVGLSAHRGNLIDLAPATFADI